MTSSELRLILGEIGLSQAEFARLIGVTARAVTLWVTEERAIPGPAEAYVRLLRLLPLNLRQVELARLKQKGTAMREGMYGIKFQAGSNIAVGLLIFEDGRVFGTDEGGVRYDGDYTFDEHTGLVAVKIKIVFPPNVRAVFGISNPYEWSFEVTTSFDPKLSSGQLKVQTSIGRHLTAQYTFLRALPDAA
jgi:transcriptional regulator with XRE-family HTH domain